MVGATAEMDLHPNQPFERPLSDYALTKSHPPLGIGWAGLGDGILPELGVLSGLGEKGNSLLRGGQKSR